MKTFEKTSHFDSSALQLLRNMELYYLLTIINSSHRILFKQVAHGADLNALARTSKYNSIPSAFSEMKHVTPLCMAVMSLNQVAVDELLKTGKCDTSYQEPYSKICALHLACRLGRVDFIRLLIERGEARVVTYYIYGASC